MNWRFESHNASGASTVRNDLLAHVTDRVRDDSDVAALLVIFSELIGNAVRHAPGPISVKLEWIEGAAVLRVRDHGAGFDWEENTQSPPDPFAEAGRGLFIVRSLSQSLSIRKHPNGGTEVRVVLPIADGHAAEHAAGPEPAGRREVRA